MYLHRIYMVLANPTYHPIHLLGLKHIIRRFIYALHTLCTLHVNAHAALHAMNMINLNRALPELQSTLQLAAEVLTLLEASATECSLELSCHSLRCGNYPLYTWSLVSI
jgi:hypothetical protein